MPRFLICSVTFLFCFLSSSPEFGSADQFPAQFLDVNHLNILDADLAPPDDEDASHAHLYDSSADYDLDLNDVADEPPTASISDDLGYPGGFDYEDQFVMPKSLIAASLYDGSGADRSWSDDEDMEDSETVTVYDDEYDVNFNASTIKSSVSEGKESEWEESHAYGEHATTPYGLKLSTVSVAEDSGEEKSNAHDQVAASTVLERSGGAQSHDHDYQGTTPSAEQKLSTIESTVSVDERSRMEKSRPYTESHQVTTPTDEPNLSAINGGVTVDGRSGREESYGYDDQLTTPADKQKNTTQNTVSVERSGGEEAFAYNESYQVTTPSDEPKLSTIRSTASANQRSGGEESHTHSVNYKVTTQSGKPKLSTIRSTVSVNERSGREKSYGYDDQITTPANKQKFNITENTVSVERSGGEELTTTARITTTANKQELNTIENTVSGERSGVDVSRAYNESYQIATPSDEPNFGTIRSIVSVNVRSGGEESSAYNESYPITTPSKQKLSTIKTTVSVDGRSGLKKAYDYAYRHQVITTVENVTKVRSTVILPLNYESTYDVTETYIASVSPSQLGDPSSESRSDEGSLSGEPVPVVKEEWAVFEVPAARKNSLRDSLSLTENEIPIATTKLSEEPSTKLLQDYKTASLPEISGLGDSNEPVVKSPFEEPIAKALLSKYQGGALDKAGERSRTWRSNNDFNRCLVPPYPCLEGEECLWTGEKITCSIAQSPLVAQPCSRNPCKNGGQCRAEGDSFRCDCQTGFSGYLCDVSEPCSPNPCHGNCKCVESCRHELGYFCRSDGGYTGKNCNIPLPQLSCESSQMSVDISPQLLEEFDRQTGNAILYASPEASSPVALPQQCRARLEGTSLKVSIGLPFNQCGTKSYRPRDGSGDQVFRNRLWLNRPGAGFDMPVPILDFECEYKREYRLVTSLKPVVNSPQVLSESGKFTADVQLCKVAACPGDCPRQHLVDGGAIYTVGEHIHLGVSSKMMVPGDIMSVDSLVLSCDLEMESLSALHLVSNNGCDNSPGIFVTTSAGSMACVTFQTPRLLSCETIYLHVTVNRCKAHRTVACPSGKQTCARPVGRRKRRSNALRQRLSTVVGPVLIINGSQGTGKLEVYPQGANRTIYVDQKEETMIKREQSMDEKLIVRPTAFKLIVLALTLVSMLVLIMVAVRYSSRCST